MPRSSGLLRFADAISAKISSWSDEYTGTIRALAGRRWDANGWQDTLISLENRTGHELEIEMVLIEADKLTVELSPDKESIAAIEQQRGRIVFENLLAVTFESDAGWAYSNGAESLANDNIGLGVVVRRNTLLGRTKRTHLRIDSAEIVKAIRTIVAESDFLTRRMYGQED